LPPDEANLAARWDAVSPVGKKLVLRAARAGSQLMNLIRRYARVFEDRTIQAFEIDKKLSVPKLDTCLS
jgi:hypothetical protein